MKILFIIAILSFSVFSQAPCTLTLKDAPALRGIQLGMTVEDVSALLGETITLTDELTQIYTKREKNEIPTVYKTIDVGVKEFKTEKFKSGNFEGVNSIDLSFYKGSLYSIRIQYSGKYTRWKDVNEFAEYLSEKLSLPKESWNKGRLECSEFSLWISVYDFGGFDSNIFLTNPTVASKIYSTAEQALKDQEEKQKQTEADKKKIFKP